MSKSNIGWCNYSWNPITGCYTDCEVCNSRKVANNFAADYRLHISDDRCIKYSTDSDRPLFILEKPFINQNGRALTTPFGFYCTYHKYRLNDLSKLNESRIIFVGSMADMFGDWVPDEWIKEIFEECKKYPQHNYLFLTRNCKRYLELFDKKILPSKIEAPNFWFGTTIDNGSALYFYSDRHNTFVNVELTNNFEMEQTDLLMNWLIIGYKKGYKAIDTDLVRNWVANVSNAVTKQNIPLFMDGSLNGIIKDDDFVRQMPDVLTQKTIVGKKKTLLYTKCSICKTEDKKSNMRAILVREHRGEGAKSLGYICQDCYPEFEKGLKNGENLGKRSN